MEPRKGYKEEITLEQNIDNFQTEEIVRGKAQHYQRARTS